MVTRSQKAGAAVACVALSVLLWSDEKIWAAESAAPAAEPWVWSDGPEGGSEEDGHVDYFAKFLSSEADYELSLSAQQGCTAGRSHTPKDVAPDACRVKAEASPGCLSCQERFPSSFDYEEGWRVPEFSHNSRIDSANWRPILSALDGHLMEKIAHNASKGGYKRLIVDIGFSHSSEISWMADVYQHPATSLVSFEPHPDTFRSLETEVAAKGLRRKMPIALHNKGVGHIDGQHRFWLNKNSSHASFQRVRKDDYEQIPFMVNVTRLDTAFPNLKHTVVPFMKVSAGRWEYAALLGARNVLNRTGVVVADISAMPNNSAIVEHLSANGFHVYALGCGSLARIPQDRPWWWSSVLAVKTILKPSAEQFVCWDFSNTTLVCDSPHAAKYAPEGCREQASLAVGVYRTLDHDMDPVETTAMASPDTHRKLKMIFLAVAFTAIAIVGYYLVFPVAMVLLRFRRATEYEMQRSCRSKSSFDTDADMPVSPVNFLNPKTNNMYFDQAV